MTMFSRERSLDGLTAIRTALEQASVEFTDGEELGVSCERLKSDAGRKRKAHLG